jgi:tetratricopeptide (TPR) repeat protein
LPTHATTTVAGYLPRRLTDAGVRSVFATGGGDDAVLSQAITTHPELTWIQTTTEQAAGEAVTIYREPARARPDAYRPELAAALNNMSTVLADLRRLDDVLAAIEEATETYRDLAATRRDAFRAGLAAALNSLGAVLADLRRPDDALAVIEEAVTIRRELAARWPEAYRRELE